MKQANNNSIHIRNNNCSSIKKLPRIEPILTILFPLKKIVRVFIRTIHGKYFLTTHFLLQSYY